MGRIVVAAFRPKSGREAELVDLVRSHVPRLRELGLVTAREAICMVARDGTILEVFEWSSAEAIEAAHSDPEVQAMWGEFAEVCEYLPMGSVSEAADLFSEFAPLDGVS